MWVKKTNKIERLCQTIAALHPEMAQMCQNGHCYQFALILRSQFPEGKIVYSHTEGHVYFHLEGYWYDIRGKHIKEPDCCTVLCHQSGHRPHRWAKFAGWEITNKSEHYD